MARRPAFGSVVYGSLAQFLPCRGERRSRRSSPGACPSRRPGAVPAVPGWNSALQTWVRLGTAEYSCCAGVRRREVAGYCGPAFLLYRTGSPAHYHRTIWWLEVSLFLLYRDVGHDRCLSSETYLSQKPGVVPAVPDWPPAPQTWAWLETVGYSCCAGVRKRRGAGYCECPFLPCRAEDLVR